MSGRLSPWQKGAIIVVSALLAVPLLAFVALWIWIESNTGDPPKLFADVPQDFRDDGPWVARMVATFPQGTPETVLIQRLRAEGFEVDPVTRSATYGWSTLVCDNDIEARWSAVEGRVTTTFARYMNACL